MRVLSGSPYQPSDIGSTISLQTAAASVSKSDINLLSGQMGVYGVFLAGATQFGTPNYTGVVKKVVTQSGGQGIRGAAHIRPDARKPVLQGDSPSAEQFAVITEENEEPPTGPAIWTFLVYMDGDNNLEAEAIADFLEMPGSVPLRMCGSWSSSTESSRTTTITTTGPTRAGALFCMAASRNRVGAPKSARRTWAMAKPCASSSAGAKPTIPPNARL
jgi:hypothetical protein